MNLLDLFVKFTADTKEYDAAIADTQEKASSWGGKIKTAMAVGGAAIAAVGTAAATMATSLVRNAGQVASYGDNIDKMSQKMGLSATAYQEWDAIMQHSGTSIESLQSGMKTLANAVESGNDAFERLGITQEDIASMDQEQLFSATITALQNVDNETERTYLAGQLLGRGATELGALLNTSAEDTEAMRQRVHELGGVMSDEAVAASAAYQDSLQDMQTAFSGLSRGLVSEFLPGITTVMDGLTAIFSGDSEAGIGVISTGITQVVDQITLQLPAFLEVGVGIVEALLTAIIDNLPELISAGAGAVMQITEAIVENLPEIIDAALQVILALADGIVDALPELIPAVVDTILAITEKLTEPDMILQLIDAAFRIMEAIAQGLIDAIPRIVTRIPTIILNIVQALAQGIPQLLTSGVQLIVGFVSGIVQSIPRVAQAARDIFTKIKDTIKGRISDALTWGRDLINNFVNGIKNKIQAVKDTISNVASTIKSFLGFSEPEKGPLSNFHTYAPDMMKLFAQGIKDNENVIEDQFQKSLDMTVGADLSVSGSGVKSSGVYSPVINVYQQPGEDMDALVRKIEKVMVRNMKRQGVAYA